MGEVRQLYPFGSVTFLFYHHSLLGSGARGGNKDTELPTLGLGCWWCRGINFAGSLPQHSSGPHSREAWDKVSRMVSGLEGSRGPVWHVNTDPGTVLGRV